MAQEYKGIIAGISVDKENEIQPEFDASVYKFIIGQNGHNLTFTPSNDSGTSYLTVNGFVVADGVRAFFNNVTMTVKANGYVYVAFKMHYDKNIADTAEIVWSDSEIAETHDSIGNTAGTYIMKLLDVKSSVGTLVNSMSYPHKAYHAEEANVISGRIESEVTAVTQDIANSSKKVATTEFVHNLYDDAIKNVKKLSSISWTNLDSPRSTVSLEKNRTNFVQGRIQLSSVGLSNTGSWKIGTLPEEYRPKQAIETAAGYSGTYQVLYLNIATNGDISLGFTGNPTDSINIDTNIGYETV